MCGAGPEHSPLPSPPPRGLLANSDFDEDFKFFTPLFGVFRLRRRGASRPGERSSSVGRGSGCCVACEVFFGGVGPTLGRRLRHLTLGYSA